MKIQLLIAIITITLALIFYTIGVWCERRDRKLRWIHFSFFSMGLVCDITGTRFMSIIANEGSAEKTVNGGILNLHGLTGYLAIALMGLHAIWALVVLARNNEKQRGIFHRFSIIVWLVWLIPFILGMFMGMGQRGTTDEKTGISEKQAVAEEKEENNISLEETEEKTLIDPSGKVLGERILVPVGYERTKEDSDSLAEFIRSYKVLPDGSPVLLYTGTPRASDSAACVFDMHLGDKDLQQCADSVIRMYAEYMRASGKEDRIAFHFVSGFLCDWQSYRSGKRIRVSGNDVVWSGGGSASDTDETFEGYLETVFTYASTLSMANESETIDISDISVGDIFIKGGSPGHVVMVADVCEKDGKKAFLLAQGYMPAQQFHVLKNTLHEDDPWYYEDEVSYPFHTPEYTFDEGSLMRPGYL